MEKSPYLGSLYIGNTAVDIHGYDKQVEEVYIADTDIDITELINELNWDKFQKDADYAAYCFRNHCKS